ncbi:cytochrome c [Shewanella sp. 202IG2-18]|uniref:c-type cytochrome n=1 Tax=Parashewanella hymeniacidonis TaxID=2807618 RepID=UPI0019613010|nr:c-type cytochrome [Parashewanella hymeniacidonis]MBM7072203.1 cytochrome c [Parashewanella hymeniacidonis]
MRNKNYNLTLLFVFTIGLALNLEAKQPSELYQSCTACHGEQGQGNEAIHAPEIAGQHAWYLQKQLQDFKHGRRGVKAKDLLGKQMAAMMKPLSDKDIIELSEYISSFNTSSNQVNTTTEHMNGYRYYQAKCGACHGGVAEGNQAFSAPRLAGLGIEYLQRQMSHFKTGIRGYAQDDKVGRQMAMMSKIVNDKELGDILNYVSKL